MLKTGGGLDVLCCGFAPVRAGLAAMEIDILLAGKQIEDRAWNTSKVLEVVNRGGVHVDAAEAAKDGFDIPNASAPAIEAARATAEAAEEVKMIDTSYGCSRHAYSKQTKAP